MSYLQDNICHLIPALYSISIHLIVRHLCMFLRPEQRAITSPVIQEKQGGYFFKCNNNPCASACLMGASVSGIDDIREAIFPHAYTLSL